VTKGEKMTDSSEKVSFMLLAVKATVNCMQALVSAGVSFYFSHIKLYKN
jgi:hypothetical protein